MASCQSIRQFPTRRPSSKGYCSFAYSAFPLAEFSTELRLPHEESSLTRIASKRRTAGGATLSRRRAKRIAELEPQLGCGAPEAKYRLAVPARRYCHIARLVADINARGIGMYHLQTEILALDLPHRLSSLLPVHLVRFALQWAVFDFHADLPREFNVARPGQRNLHNLSSGCVAVCSRRLRLRECSVTGLPSQVWRECPLRSRLISATTSILTSVSENVRSAVLI
jgi:hypothetical protein